MKEITKKWLGFAKADLDAAKVLLDKSKKHLYANCYYHLHQAIEKSLKAVLVENNQRIPKTHDLVDLLELTGSKLPRELVEFIENLNPFYNPIRYPDSFEELKSEFTKSDVNKYYKLTKETIKWMHYLLTKKG